MAPKQSGRPKAAPASGNDVPITKKRAVALTLESEMQVKALLEELASNAAPSTDEPFQSPAALDKAKGQFATIYDALSCAGFSPKWVEDALRSLPLSRPSLDDALDWLCLHSPAAELPRRFAAGLRTGQQGQSVKLIAKTQSDHAGAAPSSGQDCWEDEWPPAAATALQSGAQAVATAKPVLQAVVKEQPAVSKAWILDYANGSNSSAASASGDSETSSDTELAAMALWADPREVARRRHDRSVAKLPPEVRRAQLAQDYVTAKQGAVQAKAAGNANSQKELGLLIRNLKSEMDEVGLTDAEAVALCATAAASSAASGDGAAGPSEPDAAPGDALDGFWDIVETETEPAAAAAARQPADLDSITTPHGLGQASSTQRSVDGATAAALEAEDLGMGLFDGDVEWESTSAQQAASRLYEGKALDPAWGAAAGAPAAKPKKRTTVAKGQQAAPPDRQPQALLAQYCHRQGWPQPRYQQAPARDAAGNIMYTVTLDLGRHSKFQSLAGIRTYRLPADDPSVGVAGDVGSSSAADIRLGQNIAAVRALWELLGGTQPLHKLLGEPFRSLWMRWDEQGGEDMRQSQAVDGQQAKLGLLDSLFAGARVGRVPRRQILVPSPLVAPPTPTPQQAPQQSEAESDEWEGVADFRSLDTDAAEDDISVAAAVATNTEQTPQEKRISASLLEQQRRWASSEAGGTMLAARHELPIHQIRGALLAALQQTDIIIVSGDTGCGKTTQVPQYILEAAVGDGDGARCSVVVTQPRRLAAISVAERVAAERGEQLPGERGGPAGAGGSHVGYHVRLDARVTRDTRLLFCTTGILLRRLASDLELRSVTHIVVDEIHERTLQGDFLMALLKELVTVRRAQGAPLKVVLMSATMDAQRYGDYFGPHTVMLTAQGRTFPVTSLFLEDCYAACGYRLEADNRAALRVGGAGALASLKKQVASGRVDQAVVRDGWGDEDSSAGPLNANYDASAYMSYPDFVRRNLQRVNEDVLDYDLMEALISHIDETGPAGAILVFLPGLGEIRNLLDRLSAIRRFAQGEHWLVPLHSSVSPQEQRRALKVPPPGVRKIVVATNIAETSLTIEDVVYVIDSGKHKERRYDPRRHMSLLVEDWTSRASALQRRGRAGRVRAGTCYSLFTQRRWENDFRKFGTPEITRVPLEELVLQIHLMRLGPASQFLAKVIEPPSVKAITSALETLEQVGALTRSPGALGDGDEGEALTPLGQHLALLPCEPHLGKLLLLGALLGCLSPALTMAAVMSHQSPFASPLEQRDAAERARLALCAPGTKSVASGQQSDHLVMVAAFDLWRTAAHKEGPRAATQLARKYFMNEQALEALADIRRQFATILADVQFIEPPQGATGHGRTAAPWVDDMTAEWNKHAQQPAVVKAVLCAALSPNVAVMSEASVQHQSPRWLDASASGAARNTTAAVANTLSSTAAEEVFLHPTCLATNLMTAQVAHPFVVFLEKIKTSRVFLRDVTPVSPLGIMLFGGTLRVIHEEGLAVVGGWLRIAAPAQTAVLIRSLRGALDAQLAARMLKPGATLRLSERVISTISSLLVADERSSRLNL